MNCFCRVRPCIGEHRLCICRCGHRRGDHANDVTTSDPCLVGVEADDTAPRCPCGAFWGVDGEMPAAHVEFRVAAYRAGLMNEALSTLRLISIGCDHDPGDEDAVRR